MLAENITSMKPSDDSPCTDTARSASTAAEVAEPVVIKVPLRPWQIKHATAPEDRIPKAGIASATLVALPESLTYGISQLANPVLNVMLGVNPILIGVMQGITTTINGCADPILGHLSDNTRSRWAGASLSLLSVCSRARCCFP